MGLWTATKNLPNIILPRRGQRGAVRRWQSLTDWANRELSDGQEKLDYTQALENVRMMAVVMACVGWVAVMLPRCPWKLEVRKADAWEPIPSHPILDLLANPTPWHGGPEMLSALVIDYLLPGTGYWQRVSTADSGPPQELWWRPANYLSPVLNESRTTLAGFEYAVDGKTYPWKPDDVIQVRNPQHGQNPSNPWLGVSPLYSLAPEVWINEHATEMTAALLKNLGQVGVALIIKDSEAALNAIEAAGSEGVKNFKKYLRESYSGTNRGDALFVEFPADLHGGNLADPAMMHPKGLRDYVQEMVCSVYRLPPAVLQFGVGLEAATQNATMMQLEKQAWETGILPVQDILASQIGRQLLPAFELDTKIHRLGFDTSKIEVLQRDRREEAEMYGQLVRDGIITRATALESLGLPFNESDQVRHLPISVIEVPDGTSQVDADAARLPAADDDDPDDDE